MLQTYQARSLSLEALEGLLSFLLNHLYQFILHETGSFRHLAFPFCFFVEKKATQ